MLPVLNAFCPHGPRHVAGARTGPLTGIDFAAKDLFDVTGFVTGAGHPLWLATHQPAIRTAPAVQALLDAGAHLVGKTISDALAFGLSGENVHYGTPLNPACPERLPGGSSSGSASAVAGRAVDVALGTDTGGSVRAPASYCGIYGIRPTHGAITMAGVVPLAPSFDTVGWFSRDPVKLISVGNILLPVGAMQPPSRFLLPLDALDLLDDHARVPIADAITALGAQLGDIEPIILADVLGARPWRDWLPPFQHLQWREIWTTHGDWINAHQPAFGDGVAERFAATARVNDDDVATATAFRDDLRAAAERFLSAGIALVIPTMPDIAPLKGASAVEIARVRRQALTLLCFASLAGLPQLSMPIVTIDGCPIGISLVGGPHADRSLLTAATTIRPTA